jgi:acetylornithine deacetylase/succinyl-diaminopimelate desuccinylase-like protein
MLKVTAVAAVLAFSAGAIAADSKSRAGEPEFRSLYKELIETNTSLSVGSCTLAAERMATRLKAAGIEQVQVFAAPDHPKEGGLVALYPGSDAKVKAMLLLAHIDVVEAKREDWTRDPFVLVEENGSFYARGAVDDKAEAAIWVDTLIRYSQEKFKPRRAIKLALTCGEETAGAFNGAEWLSKNHRDWIDAEFALNEGAWGEMDAQGNHVAMNVQAGEKAAQNYRLEVTNPGGTTLSTSWPMRCRVLRHTNSRRSSPTRAGLTSPAWRRSRPRRATPKLPRR